MKHFLFYLFTSFPMVLFANLPTDENEYRAWEESKIKAIEALKDAPPEEAIPQLGRIVRQLSLNPNIEKGDRPVFHAAQNLLLSIPGHAEYYGNEIKKITEEQITGTFPGHGSQRGFYGQTLEQLPSPETVKVLGELLSDERDPWKNLGDAEGGRPLPNSTLAVIALNNLGIKNAPVKKNYYDPADVHTWQLWFGQVQAGTKTFSFEGSPQEYSLKGPVTSPAAARRERSVTQTAATSSTTATSSGSSWSLIATVAACAILAIGGWRLLKNRRQA